MVATIHRLSAKSQKSVWEAKMSLPSAADGPISLHTPLSCTRVFPEEDNVATNLNHIIHVANMHQSLNYICFIWTSRACLDS